MLQQLGAAYVSSIFATTLAIALLIVVLVWRPNGLFGRGARREDNRAAGAHVIGVRTRLDPRTARIARRSRRRSSLAAAAGVRCAAAR